MIPNNLIKFYLLKSLKLKTLLFKVILFYALYYIYATYFKLIKSNHNVIKYEYYENVLCKPVNLSLAEDIAKYYMSKSTYFEECDKLKDINLVEIEDVFCNLNIEICKNLELNESNNILDVVYSMKLNMKGLAKELRRQESEIICNVERFVRVSNNTMEILTKTIERFIFQEKDNYVLYFKSHGYYQVNVFLNIIGNGTKLYQDFYYIFPYNMSILLEDSKHRFNKRKALNQNSKITTTFISNLQILPSNV